MKMSDIVILIDTHKEGLEIKKFLEETLKEEAKIMDIFSLNGSDKKYKFRVNSPHLKMSTIHSFKGWEARNVIILIPQKVNIDSQIYTSLTRVQENLFILNLNQKYTDFGKNNFNKFDF